MEKIDAIKDSVDLHVWDIEVVHSRSKVGLGKLKYRKKKLKLMKIMLSNYIRLIIMKD